MIYVFKTSVLSENDIKLLKPHLEELHQIKWNFDLEDCDKILRIDSPTEISIKIKKVLLDIGFDCEELTD